MRQSLVARYLLLHACAGVGVGVLVAGGLLLTHALHLRQLISASADAAAAAIFILGGITTIAPLVFATAVGLLAGADLDPTCRPLTADHPALQPRAWNPRRHSDQGWITPIVPFVLVAAAFTLLYYVVPNCPVSWRDSLAAGGVAALLFESAKHGFALYIIWFPTYNAIYGTLAAIPVLLAWIYLCWIATLVGAEFAAALPEWRSRPAGETNGLPPEA